MLGTTFIVGVQILREMRSQFSSGCCWTNVFVCVSHCFSPCTRGQDSGPQTSLGSLLHSVSFVYFLFLSLSTVQTRLGIFSSLAHSVTSGSLQIISVAQLATS